MADLRIVDAPLLSTVKGTEKIPTGGEGNFSVSVNQVADFAKLKWFLATEGYVNNAVGSVQSDLNLHKNNINNPHGTTKAQVGLDAVDNTADLDKPLSNANIAALSLKADKMQVASDLNVKADKVYVDSAVGAISTDASKQYATLALANADIANIPLNKNVFISEYLNGGYWYKATAEVASLTKSPYDPLLQAKQYANDEDLKRTSVNIWTDTFHESAFLRPFMTNSVMSYAGTLNVASSSSPYNRPYLSYASGGNAQSIRELTDLPLMAGDYVTARVHASFTTGSGQATLYFRNSSGGVISNVLKTLTSSDSGDQIINFDTIQIPTGTTRIELRVNQGGDGKLYAASLGKGYALPAFSYNPEPFSTVNRVIAQKNLYPDAFLRQYAAGITHQNGWNFGQIAGLAVQPIITTSDKSPMLEQRVIRFPTGAGQLDMFVDAKRLGLKSGDKLTVILGVYAAQSINLAVFGRTETGTVVGSGTNTAFTFATAGQSREIKLTINIDETFAKTCNRLNIRFGNSLTVGATPVEIWGRGIFVNATDPLLYDDCYQDDMLAIQAFRSLPLNTNTMRETQKRIAEIQFGAQRVYSLALIGDSFTHLRQRYSEPLAVKLQSELGYAGNGWIGFGNPDAGGTGNINGSVLSTITVTTSGGIPSSTYRTAASPDICSVTLTDTTVQYRINNIPSDTTSLKLLAKINTGIVEYSTDNGVTWTEIDLSTGNNVNVTTLDTPSTAFNLYLRYKSGTVVLYGLDHRKGASGVIVHKLGATGSSLQEWATQASGIEWKSGVAAINPNAVAVMLATNDQTGSREPQLFKKDMQSLVDAIATALPYADILLMSPPENQRNNNVKMAAYTSVIKDVALTNNYAFHDLQQDYGRKSSDYASTSVRNWFKSDNVHPNEDTTVNGGYPIASRIRKIILTA